MTRYQVGDELSEAGSGNRGSAWRQITAIIERDGVEFYEMRTMVSPITRRADQVDSQTGVWFLTKPAKV